MQFTSTKKPPPGIVYDSDLGNSIDTTLALALLHGADGKNFARVASISISKANLKAAQYADVIEKFYTGTLTGLSAVFFQAQPIGLAADGMMANDTALLTAVLSRKNDAGELVYSSKIGKLYDTAIAEVLIRNALMAQYDRNAVVVLSGPATNLVRVLDLPGAKEVVASKVKFLSMAGGNFSGSAPDGAEPDPYFKADVKAARRLLAEWPTPVILAGRELGAALRYPGSSIEKDYSYAPTHPIPAAYRAAQPMPHDAYDAPVTAMAAALYAVRPDEGYYKLSGPGTIHIADDGRASFEASASGKHRYLIVDPGQAERVVKAYTEMASAQPVRRVRRPVVDADQADEKKADPTKDPPARQP